MFRQLLRNEYEIPRDIYSLFRLRMYKIKLGVRAELRGCGGGVPLPLPRDREGRQNKVRNFVPHMSSVRFYSLAAVTYCRYKESK